MNLRVTVDAAEIPTSGVAHDIEDRGLAHWDDQKKSIGRPRATWQMLHPSTFTGICSRPRASSLHGIKTTSSFVNYSIS
jgi:hypothetical protein